MKILERLGLMPTWKRALITCWLAALVLASAAHAQEDLARRIPIDARVRLDTLANGLVYYIRENTEPAGRVQLRLVVNAGSILEDDDQKGLAHFVEHMLFNGTQRFHEQELVDFFERSGMRFGPDINAYTSFDETVYRLEAPTDSAAVLRKGFAVLEEWAAHATLSSEEIEKERGVVVEEWRRGLGAFGRIRDQVLPVLLHGSRYAERLPIGDTLVLQHSPHDALRRYYRDWYRTDLMAVIVVGDIEADTAEALIHKHFAALPASAAPRPQYDVPSHEETLYKVAADPEYPFVNIEIYFKKRAEQVEIVGDFRRFLLGRLFTGMLNRRLAEIARDGARAPFLWGRVSRGALVRPSLFHSLAAQVEEDSITAGLGALLTEAARARRHGFTQPELDRQKLQLLRAYEHSNNEREHTNSSVHAQQYVGHFLRGSPIPGIGYEFDLAGKLMDGITLAEVDAQVRERLTESDRVVLVSMPEKEGLERPSEEDLAAVFTRVEHMDIDPYVEEVTLGPLLPVVPDPVAIAQEREIPELGITEHRLANGIRLILKPTEFKQDEVRFTAFSEGGTSLADDEDYFTSALADILIQKGGVGSFDQSALVKRLSGKSVSVAPFIGELSEGLSGQASPSDLQTLFQLIHLYVTSPRADSLALLSFQNQQRSMLQNRQALPATAFQDSLRAALYGDHPRRAPLTVAVIDSLDLDKALAFYHDRFADTDDFTFIFVGNFQPDTLKALAQTYLGTLPASPREETWRDNHVELPLGSVVKEARGGRDPQSRVGIIFHGPFDYHRALRHRLQSLEAILDIRLREELREARGGIYGASVTSSATDKPDPQYTISIFFGCAPERVSELTQAVFSEIDRITEGDGLEDDLAKVLEQQRRSQETSLEQNSFWLSTLRFYYGQEEESVFDLLNLDELINTITTEDIQQAARDWLGDRYVQVTLIPEADLLVPDGESKVGQ